MTTKQVDTWFVIAATVILLSGRAVGHQGAPPGKNADEKKAEARFPKEQRPPMPPEPDRRRPGVDPFGPDKQRPGADSFRGGDGQPPGGFRGSGGRGTDGPGLFAPRESRPPRQGGGMGQPQDFGHMPGESPQERLERMKSYDPEMAELESKDQDLERLTEAMSQELRRTPRDQRDALKKQLHELVQKHFDTRQARRDLQLKRLETELERMQESMKKRVEMRDQIIGRRVAELAGEQNEFDF